MINARLLIGAILFASLFAIGCEKGDKFDVSLSGSNGEKLKIKSDGENGGLSATGSNGEHLDLRADNGEMTLKATDANGEKVDATLGKSVVITESDLGVPFYPGSVEQGSNQMRAETDKEKSFISFRVTSDEPSKVVEFYKDKIRDYSTSESSTSDMATGTCQGKLDSGAKFTMTAERKKDSSKTEIKIDVTVKR
jgi:hypothetical protein